MKKLILILIISFVFLASFGQDKINIKDQKQLEVKVLEQNDKYIKFKRIDYEDGPIFTIKTNRIYSVEYGNGYIEYFGNHNPRKCLPLGINAGFLPGINEEGRIGGFLTSNFDYFIIPQIELEISIGTNFVNDGMYLAAGSRFHLNSIYSEKRWTPFTGLMFGTIKDATFIQVPVGINYISGKGFNASVSLNEMILDDFWQAIFLDIRLGWRFKK